MKTLGNQTITIELHSENHKTGIELEAAAAIKKGQPIKLTSVGKATPWAKADLQHTFIGHARWDAAIGDMVTIASRGYAILHGISNAAVTCGPITYEGLQASGQYTGIAKYGSASVDATNCIGWALDDAAGAGELIRVLMKD